MSNWQLLLLWFSGFCIGVAITNLVIIIVRAYRKQRTGGQFGIELGYVVAELDAAKATIEDEEAAVLDTLRLWQEAKAQYERAMQGDDDLIEAMARGIHQFETTRDWFNLESEEMDYRRRRARAAHTAMIAALDSPSPGETG